ncbi:MAG: cysteine--tRNA ligase [Anaerolineae bacterium]|nr:cysteine--tRNA ligase [Anaerolineae bacterium]
MTLKVYNYMARQKEEFKPIHEGRVGIYVCGPTVYGHAHIGHAKVYVSFDVVVRYLRYLGYKVRYVQNITDVGHLTDDADEGEDKVGRKARLEQLQPMEVVDYYTRSYFEDMDALNVTRPDISARASGHVPEQIELAQILIERGCAYEANGSVFFSVESFPEYGKLSGRRVDELEEGARVQVNPDKRHPADFAVWRAASPGHLMRWKSPWGEGYPGWHAECSVMAAKYLGLPFDIHGGGLENIFPHNESEIAQSEAAYGVAFARYWLLNNMVTVDGVKMGKSLGNFVTIKDALQRHEPMTIRFFILSSHYRSPTDFSEAALEAAGKGLERLYGAVRLVRDRLATAEDGGADAAFQKVLDEHKARFTEAMDDDFNTPQALAAFFDLTKEVNTLLNSGEPVTQGTLEAIDGLYRELGGDVLGIIPDQLPEEAGAGLEDALVQILIDLRQESRQAKDWAKADAIRDRLAEVGIALEDGPEGTRWRLERNSGSS